MKMTIPIMKATLSMKMTTFEDVKVGEKFYKWQSLESVPYIKIDPIVTSGFVLNCHDDNTGELFFVSNDRLVYQEQ